MNGKHLTPLVGHHDSWEPNLWSLLHILSLYYSNNHLKWERNKKCNRTRMQFWPGWWKFFLCRFECCLDSLTCFKHKCNAFSCHGCIFQCRVPKDQGRKAEGMGAGGWDMPAGYLGWLPLMSRMRPLSDVNGASVHVNKMDPKTKGLGA